MEVSEPTVWDYASDASLWLAVGSGVYVLYEFYRNLKADDSRSDKKRAVIGSVLFLLIFLIYAAGKSAVDSVDDQHKTEIFQANTEISMSNFEAQAEKSSQVLERVEVRANSLLIKFDAIEADLDLLQVNSDKSMSELKTLQDLRSQQIAIARAELRANGPVFERYAEVSTVSNLEEGDSTIRFRFDVRNNGKRPALKVKARVLILYPRTSPDYPTPLRGFMEEENDYEQRKVIAPGGGFQLFTTSVPAADWKKVSTALILISIRFTDSVEKNFQDQIIKVYYVRDQLNGISQFIDYNGQNIDLYNKGLIELQSEYFPLLKN